MIEEIQARHDDRKSYHRDFTAVNPSESHNDIGWLLSDRTRLETEHAEAILHKDLAIKSLEIINREQETEIKLLRGIIAADDYGAGVIGYAKRQAARAALAEFDKWNHDA